MNILLQGRLLSTACVDEHAPSTHHAMQCNAAGSRVSSPHLGAHPPLLPQAPAEAVAAAAIFPYEVAVGGGRKSSLSAASQAPLSTPSALRVRRRASCELIMDRDKTGLLQLLQGRGSSVMQAVTAAQQQEDGSMGSLAAALYSAATTTNGGITMGAAVARNKAVGTHASDALFVYVCVAIILWMHGCTARTPSSHVACYAWGCLRVII